MNEITKFDENYYRQLGSLGMQNVTSEDLPTPTMSIVQPSGKAVDEEGRPFPRGTFLFNYDNKAYKTLRCSMFHFRKEMRPSYEDKDIMEKNYIFQGIHEETGKPFQMFFKRTGMWAAKQFLGTLTKKYKGMPLFAFRLELSTEYIKNGKNEYYNTNWNIMGLNENPERVTLLTKLASEAAAFDKPDSPVQVEEVQAVGTQNVEPDDIPF